MGEQKRFRSLETIPNGYCGTSYAAKLMNLSVGTVQNLVETNRLKAWKTNGGHRRISVQSIHEYLFSNNVAGGTLYSRLAKFRVLVIEGDPSTRAMYQACVDSWEMPLEVAMYDSAHEALLNMSVIRPEVLLTDLRLQGMDGFRLIKALHSHPLYANLPIIVLTGLSRAEIEFQGGLPKSVQVLPKPIDMEWLRGYIGASIAFRRNLYRTVNC